MDGKNLDEWITLEQAAPLLGLKNGNTVQSYIARGVLDGKKLGRDWFTTRRQIAAYLSKKKGRGYRYTDRYADRPRKTSSGYIDPMASILPPPKPDEA